MLIRQPLRLQYLFLTQIRLWTLTGMQPDNLLQQMFLTLKVVSQLSDTLLILVNSEIN